MTWWRYAVWAVVVAYMASGFVSSLIYAESAAEAVFVAVLYVVGTVCCYVAYSRASWDSWLLVTAAVIGLGLHALVAFSGISVLFLAVWIAPFRMRLWPAVALVTASTGGFLAISMATEVPEGAIVGVSFGLGWAGFLAAILNQLAVTRRQSAEVALAHANTAVLNERQRLAREIHDILAHSLSAQVMHLEGARLLLERDADRAMVLDRVIRAGDLARSGLDETKRAVEALRGDQTPLPEQLEKLAAHFRSTTGRPCSLTISGDPQLAPEAWLAVVRTAQEALTNVHRHAPEAQVAMDFRCTERWCELQVQDHGGRPSGETGNGYGLVGMRERAELIGGTLDAGPVDDGFRVRLRVPA
ncbi:MAG: sensor histidine kinase [Kibdelosporangium sp.]